MLPLSLFLLLLTIVLAYVFDLSAVSFINQDTIISADKILSDTKILCFAPLFLKVSVFDQEGAVPKSNVFIFFITALAIVSLLVLVN